MNPYAQAKGKTPFCEQGKYTYLAKYQSINNMRCHEERIKADSILEASKETEHFCKSYSCKLTSISQIK